MTAKFPRRFIIVYFIIIALLWGVAYCLYPYFGDDIWYRNNFKDYLLDPDIESYFRNFASEFKARFLYDNSRLCNTVAMALTPFPRWLSGAVCACAAVLMCILAAAYAGCLKRHFAAFALLQALLIFGLPWYDSMLEVMFAFNYVVSAVVMLCVTIYFLRKPGGKPLPAFAAGLIGSLCHESFGLAIIAGASLTALFFKSYRNGRSLSFIGAAIIGLIFLIVLTPGSAYRLSAMGLNEASDFVNNAMITLIPKVKSSFPLIIIWLSFGIRLFKKAYRRSLLTPKIV